MMMGEQGAESIRAYFNRLGKIFDVMPDRLQRLKRKMKEYLLHVAPAAKPIKMDSNCSQPIFIRVYNYSYVPTLPHAYPFSSFAPKGSLSLPLHPKFSAHASSRFNAPFYPYFMTA